MSVKSTPDYPRFSAQHKYDEFRTPYYTRGLRRDFAMLLTDVLWGEKIIKIHADDLSPPTLAYHPDGIKLALMNVLDEQGYVCKQINHTTNDFDFDSENYEITVEIDWDATAAALESNDYDDKKKHICRDGV